MKKLPFIVLLVSLSHLTICFRGMPKLSLTENDVVKLLHKNETKNFIMGFNNSYQRWIITQQLSNCPFVPLCGFTFGLQESVSVASCCKRCNCDFPACMIKNSCCPDVIFKNVHVTNNTTFTRKDLKLLTEKDTPKTCIQLFLGNSSLKTGQESVYAFSSCLMETSKELEQNCTRAYTADIDVDNISDIAPVLHTASNELYRNKYCAYCHNISDGEIQAFKSHISCKLNQVTHLNTEKDLIVATLHNKLCDITFIPEARLDRCLLGISKCNMTGLWTVYDSNVQRACELYTSIVRTNNISFQNVFCNECNGFNKPTLQCERSLSAPEENDFSFSGLLKLNRRGPTGETGPTDLACSENQFYDKILRTCKDIFCSFIMTLSQGKCNGIYEKLEKALYAVFFRIKPNQQVSVYESHQVADKVINYISIFTRGTLCSVEVLLQSNMMYEEENEDNIETISNSSLLYYDARIQFYIGMYHDPEDVIKHIFNSKNFSISSHNISFEMRVRDGDPKPFDIVAFISETIDPSEINPGSVENFGSLPLSVLIRDYASPGENKLAVIPYPRRISGTSSCAKSLASLNVLWLKSCPKVNISKSDFPWIKHADGLIIQHGLYELTGEDFYYADDDHIVVCLESYKDFMSKVPSLYKFSFSVETIVSVVCSSLSIISLIITLVAFSIFYQLRQTIPGKNSMSLVFYLLCAQCLYMIKGLSRFDTDSTECILVGMSVHFFWLVALFWMNNCTFHMFRVLSKTKVIAHSSGLKKVVLYHVYALGMAAIFVSVNSTMSYYSSGHMGYGGSVCYISSQEMINYTFVVPTCFVIVTNISMFLIVVIKIRRISSVQKNVQRERNDLLVFTKLSTITGATWAFGILYSWTNVTVFSYLFIILNAFQGVFIMLAFIVNKRVYNLVRSKSSAFTSSNQTTAGTSNTNVSNKS